MTEPECVELLSDGTWIIAGVHTALEKAKEIMLKEDPGAIVTDVYHCWLRYEFMSDEDVIDNDIKYYGEGKRPRWWILHETTKRPKGITKKATVLDVDFPELEAVPE